MGNNIVNAKVLFLGLDNAGKTTIIRVCENDFKPPDDIEDVKPTVGHTVTHFKSREKKEVQFGAWDLSGKEMYRSLWKHYYKDTDALIFVVDATDDEDRLDEAKEVLHQVLSEIDLKDAILLVCANKADLPHAKSTSQITEALALNKNAAGLAKRTWKLQSTCAKTGEGLQEGLVWLASELKNAAKSKGKEAKR